MIIIIESFFAIMIYVFVLVFYFCRCRKKTYVRFSNTPKLGNTSIKKEEQTIKKVE